MLDRQTGENSIGQLPRRVRCRPSGWVPGELLVPVEFSAKAIPEPVNLGAIVRGRVVEFLGQDLPIGAPDENEPTLSLSDPKAERQLLLVPVRLQDTQPEAMRRAIAAINRHEGNDVANGAILLPATPNWFAGAQDSNAGSPASQPIATAAYGRYIRYAPQPASLDLEHEAAHAIRDDRQPVQVAVLDTAPGRNQLEWARYHFPNNHHLDELLERLVPPIGKLELSALEAARVLALQRL